MKTIPDAEIHDAAPEKLIKCFESWVKKIANRYTKLLAQTGAVGFDDLCQVGKIALLNAQKKYDPDAGESFLMYSKGYIQNAMRRELGFSYDGKLPLFPLYLDETLTDESGESRIDLLPDDSIEPNEERIQRLERYEELYRAIGRLKDSRQKEIIQRVYFREENKKDAAAAMNMKPGAFQSAKQLALAKLCNDRALRLLCAPVFSTSLTKFKYTFQSAVEEEVLWKERQIDMQLGDGMYIQLQ